MISLVSKHARLLAAFGIGAGLVAAAGTGMSFVSAHGGDATKVHACYKNLPAVPGPRGSAPSTNTNPNVRIVGANESCAAGETALDWSSAGGVTGYERKSDTATIMAGQTGGVALNCGAKKVLSAGYQIYTTDITVLTSYAQADNDWYFQFHNAGGGSQAVNYFVVCATAAS